MTKLNREADPSPGILLPEHTTESSYLAWILVLFAASGCSALIYEVVWLQLLELVIGSSAVSLGLLLGAYMGGLFLGSIALARLVPPRYHPLRLYALLEFGIGILGILIPFTIPYVGRLYETSATGGLPGIVLRGLICVVCLLPPTILMGATFPALSRWLETTKVGVSRIGFFYGANIAGAVTGCLLAGFYLLRVYDLGVATYAAATINIIIALVSFSLAARSGYKRPVYRASRDHVAGTPGGPSVYAGIALSGLCALGAQVVWTRILSVMLGATVYTFSIILAVFLIGLGIGSGIGSLLAARIARPRFAFGICQMLVAVSIAWTAYTLAKSLPYWPIDPSLALSPWFNFQVDLLRTSWTLLTATLLWGASFPLALAALALPGQDPGLLAGRAYGANTSGAILGAIIFSLLFIPRIGTTHSEQVLIALSCISAITVLLPLSRASLRSDSDRERPFGRSGMAKLAISIAVILALIWTVSEIPWQAIAYGRRVALVMREDFDVLKDHPINVLYRGEGINSSVVITEQSGVRIIYVNGNAEASNGADDIRLERMAGHIPALLHTDPRDVLIVGFGAGVTAGSFTVYPQIKRITIAELEPLIPMASTRFFRPENYGVLNDPRTKVIYDDARHYILTTKDKFDIITSDPVHLWMRGASTLYSKEYFERVRGHLNPGGIVAQWLPLYDGDLETVKSVLATFFEVFPNGTVWSNHIAEDRGYDLVLLGQTGENRINVDELQERMSRPDYSAAAASLGAVGYDSALAVVATYLGQASDLKSWLTGAQINLDRNQRLQYLSGFEMNSTASEEIYQELLAHRRFPEALFAGSDRYIQALRTLLQPSH